MLQLHDYKLIHILVLKKKHYCKINLKMKFKNTKRRQCPEIINQIGTSRRQSQEQSYNRRHGLTSVAVYHSHNWLGCTCLMMLPHPDPGSYNWQWPCKDTTSSSSSLITWTQSSSYHCYINIFIPTYHHQWNDKSKWWWNENFNDV